METLNIRMYWLMNTMYSILYFGLDGMMSFNVEANMMAYVSLGGYKVPELQKIKMAKTNNDNYKFGIFLLEILMGKRPSKNASNKIVDFPNIVKDVVLEERTMHIFNIEILRRIRSPRDFGLLHALQLPIGCCAPSPAIRPYMKEVVKNLEKLGPKMHYPLCTPRISSVY